MAEEMLFTVAGSVAMPAQMISLEEAGLENRADLQEWLAANPAILGPAVKVVTFDFDGLRGRRGSPRGPHLRARARRRRPPGRRRSSRAAGPPTPTSALSSTPPWPAGCCPSRWPSTTPASTARHQIPMTAEEALAELQAHAPDLSQESLRRPRIVLLARDFSPVVTSPASSGSARWASTSALVQISAFRSYVYGRMRQQQRADDLGQPGLPVARGRGVHHQPRAPAGQGDGRVQAAGAGRRDRAPARVRPSRWRTARSSPWRPAATSASTCGPARGVAARGSRPPHRPLAEQRIVAPLVWDVDKAAYTPAALVRHIVEQATGVSRDFFGTQWWRDPTGWTMIELAGPLERGQGRPVPRVLVALARPGAARSRPLDPDVDVAGAELHHAAVPREGHPLRVAASPPAGRLRSDFFIEGSSQEASTTQFEGLQSNGERVEVAVRQGALVGEAARPRRLPRRRLQRGRRHRRRGLRFLHRLDDRLAGEAPPGDRCCVGWGPAGA